MKTLLWLVIGMAMSVSGVCLHAQEDYPISIPVPVGSTPPVYKQWPLVSRDDVKLVVHEWTPARPLAGKPVALFLHGIGMHGEPYRSIAAGFTSRGIPFVVPDLRGHGRSEGTHGELAPPDVLRADIGAVMAWIHKRCPDAPVVLLGDSMGGVIAVDYAWRGEQRLAGLALLVPALGLNKTQWEKPGGDLKNLLTHGRIVLGSESKLKPSTQSTGFLQARIDDKLALREVELSYLLTIHEMQREWFRAAAAIKVPLFICVAEKDQVIDNAVVHRFFKRAATPKEGKTWRKLDGAYHSVCWDPVTPALMDELTLWILKISK
jgi:alpha-beta hydrolase superfamily lysophospholipase